MVVPGLTVGVDGYYKMSQNLIDEGQFGAPIILTAFNYADGLQEGVKLTASYDAGRGRSTATSPGRAQSARTSSLRSSISSRMNWPTSRTTTSISIMIRPGPVRRASPTRSTGQRPSDAVLGRSSVQSGLRASTPTIPNGTAPPTYGVVNLSIVQKLASGHRAAAGRAERGGRDLRDSQRHRCGRRRAAIRAAPHDPGRPDAAFLRCAVHLSRVAGEVEVRQHRG